MHELSIANSIIRLVEKSLPHGFNGQVESVQLQIGALSGIDIDALEFSFSVIKTNSVVNSATLQVEVLEAKAFCNSCKMNFNLKKFGTECHFCKSFNYSITQGKELKIKNIKCNT